jgi:hypothetical protein
MAMEYYPNYQMYGYPAFGTPFHVAQGMPPPYPPHNGDAWRNIHHSRSAMINQSNMAKTTESKPRLSKEEVEQLEAEFQRNPKPNAHTKKGLAEQMRVDIARINVSFSTHVAKLSRATVNEVSKPLTKYH